MADASDEAGLRHAWRDALRGICVGENDAALTDLLVRYREPHRHYHDVGHLRHVVAGVQTLHAECEQVAATLLAAFFHDAVYEIGASDNEAASARLAADTLRALGAEGDTTQMVTTLVLATADHQMPAGGPGEAAVLIDADLAILASTQQAYSRYVEKVRLEYRDVPDDLWRDGRGAVIESFLRRERIYLTRPGRAWERTARKNLTRELELLRS